MKIFVQKKLIGVVALLFASGLAHAIEGCPGHDSRDACITHPTPPDCPAGKRWSTQGTGVSHCVSSCASGYAPAHLTGPTGHTTYICHQLSKPLQPGVVLETVTGGPMPPPTGLLPTPVPPPLPAPGGCPAGQIPNPNLGFDPSGPACVHNYTCSTGHNNWDTQAANFAQSFYDPSKNGAPPQMPVGFIGVLGNTNCEYWYVVNHGLCSPAQTYTDHTLSLGTHGPGQYSVKVRNFGHCSPISF